MMLKDTRIALIEGSSTLYHNSAYNTLLTTSLVQTRQKSDEKSQIIINSKAGSC